MKSTQEKPKETKLSKQQKEILRILYKNQKKNGALKYDNREISRKVYAEQYGVYPEHGDLTPRHSASVSRSAKRLEERGLIGRNKPVSMYLTGKGMKYCRSLFGDKLDKHEIGKYKKKKAYEIVAHKMLLSPETNRKFMEIKEYAKIDKDIAEKCKEISKGSRKLTINALYREVERRKAIKKIEEQSSQLARELKEKRPVFTLKETKDIISGKIKLE